MKYKVLMYLAAFALTTEKNVYGMPQDQAELEQVQDESQNLLAEEDTYSSMYEDFYK